MADIIYTVNQDSPENIEGFEQFSQEDRALVDSFQINNVFDPTKNYSELHILSLSDELVESIYDYTGYKQAAAAQSAGQEGTSALTIDPVEDAKTYGYENGGVKLLYHFLDDLYSQDRSRVDFYIQEISADRTELSLATLNIPSEELVSITSAIKNKLQNQSYFTGFRLNFKDNDLLIATNIDTLDSPTGKVVVVKLYEPLPDIYRVKSVLSIVDIVSDSLAYEIDVEIILPPVLAPTLRSPNFNIDITDNNVVPTGYYDYNELFSYPINNSNSQLFSTVKEKSIDISVDYTDFNDFVHFSSAQERLLNFKYKIDLVNSYSASLVAIDTATTGIQGISGSRDYYQNLLTGVVSNFDHYERYLYYESGSNSWPKSNTTKPYVNKISTAPEAVTWYTDQIANAIEYDQTNYNSLAYSIPSFLRDDPNNENYLTFIYMVGQHFDNLWLYSKAVTDKYDADNRIGYGISKDLVAEALENFGVKLYTSNKSIEDLFTTFVGQAYQSGSEQINVYVTGSLTGSNTPIQPVSYDDYQKEVQKRIYHNLPLLLKSKGTERGLRALINCLGIPGDILDIKLYGGRNRNERPFYGDYQNYTSSLSKIRLDNTGSLISGSTLSNYVSIIKRDDKYTDDLHAVEVGFSPSDNIDNYIISRSLATASLANFNIDDYIGDPSNLHLNNYSGLERIATTILSGSLGASGSYDLRDYVRLIKFYDNTIFKMVKYFLPARGVADTGIIIKPNLLNRSKAKSIIATGSRPEYSGSIDTAFISGRSPNTFKTGQNEYTTVYYDNFQTPTGIGVGTTHFQEEAKYNGEISGSKISVSNVNLNNANIYKDLAYSASPYQIAFVSSSNEVCLLEAVPTPFYITSSTAVWNANQFFTFTNNNCIYSASNDLVPTTWTPISFPRILPVIPPSATPGYYQDFLIKATNTEVTVGPVCTKNIQVRFATCSIFLSTIGVQTTNVVGSATGGPITDLTTWITNPNNQFLQYTASYSTSSAIDPIPSPSTYQFNQKTGTVVTITVRDANIGDVCSITKSVTVGTCTLGKKPYAQTTQQVFRGFEFQFSKYQHGTWEEQNPTEGEGYTTTPVGSGYTRLNNTLPGAVPGTGISQYRGIQSFFTLGGNLGTSLTQNPSIRYNIYRLTNTSELTDPNREDKYRLITVAEGINPGQPPSTWIPDEDLNPLESTFKNTFNISDPALYGYDNNFYAIVLNVEDSNYIFQYDQYLGNTTQDVAVNQLTRAYVIEAYNAAQESCIQQVTVYGTNATLQAAEGAVGPNNFPQYTVKRILVDWDYINLGIPNPAQYPYPFPAVVNGVLRPWKEIKVRKYGNPGTGTPP